MERLNRKALFKIGGPLVLIALASAFFFASQQPTSEKIAAPAVGQEDTGKFNQYTTDEAQYVYFVNAIEETKSDGGSNEPQSGVNVNAGGTGSIDPVDSLVGPDGKKLVLSPKALKDWTVCGSEDSSGGVSHLNLTRADCDSFTINESPTKFNRNAPYTSKAAENSEVTGDRTQFGDLVEQKLKTAAAVAKKNKLRLESPSGINLLKDDNLDELKDYYVCRQSVGSDIWLEKGSIVVLELRSQRCKYE